jgi:hypothetical protein
MNLKKFLFAGIVGGIVDFLLGWLFYGILFKNSFPSNGIENLYLIFFGCMTFGFMLAFIYAIGAHVSKCIPGMKYGAFFGLLLALYTNFFMYATAETINYPMVALDIAISVLLGTIVGSVVAVVNGKVK